MRVKQGWAKPTDHLFEKPEEDGCSEHVIVLDGAVVVQ
jgi:hypothetical protein